VGLQTLENKALSRGIIRRSACILAEITIRKSQALSHLRAGDTLIVWRLDRLGRSLKHLIETVTMLKNHGVAFKSLTENIDTATATGNLVFHIFGALAEFERNLITERTMAGLDAARARGRKGGRPPRNPSAGKVAMAKKLYRDRVLTIPEILKTLHISRATLYRWVNAGGGIEPSRSHFFAPAYRSRKSTLVQREDFTTRVSRGTVCTLHPARADGGDTHGKRNQDTTWPSCMVKASFAWS
jgi:hypothetical protein